MPIEKITNPGFEVDTSGWGPFFSSCTLARSTAQAHTGSASGLLTASGANNYIGVNAFASQTGDLVTGRSYTASVWVYLPVADGGTYTFVAQDANGDWGFNGTSGSITANTWTLLTCTFNMGTWVRNFEEFTFRLNRSTGTYSGQTLYWDDLSLLEDTTALKPSFANHPKPRTL